MRILYLLTFVSLAPTTVPALFESQYAHDVYEGLVMAFWSALSILSLLGIFYPLKMIPLLLVQFFYKSLWLIAVAIPLYLTSGVPEQLSGLVFANSIGAILDLLIIPWGYVFWQARKTGASFQLEN